jgi:Flp pilus assembly protein TadD
MNEAIEIYRRVTELDPLDAEARLALAAALLAGGQAEAARLEAGRAANLRPGDPEAQRIASIAPGSGER